MIIGFGKVELEREKQIAKEITAKFKEMYEKSKCTYFTDELINEFKEWIKEYSGKYHRQAEEYKKKSASEVPQRYSYFWQRITGDTSNLYIRLNLLHINRQHALSPDGWALIERNLIIHIKEEWDDTLSCGLYRDGEEI
jgi:hypothetical protein